jgi:hypothetical protein
LDEVDIVDTVHMTNIPRMGRKKLGKEAYQFTCLPKLMEQFDKLADAQGLTRSDLLVMLMREHMEKHGIKPKGGK